VEGNCSCEPANLWLLARSVAVPYCGTQVRRLHDRKTLVRDSEPHKQNNGILLNLHCIQQ
jgi:hypothetical protein